MSFTETKPPFSGGAFEENVAEMKAFLAQRGTKSVVLAAKLTCAHHVCRLANTPTTLNYLLARFVMKYSHQRPDEDLTRLHLTIEREDLQAFYAEIWNAPEGQHLTIDWLRRCPAHVMIDVKIELQDEPGALATSLSDLFEQRRELTAVQRDFAQKQYRRLCVGLENGVFRAAELEVLTDGTEVPTYHEWVKKGIVLGFSVNDSMLFGPGSGIFDKVPLRHETWRTADFEDAQIRIVPGAVVRQASFLGRKVIVMPGGFVNVGAHVGDRTMIDRGACVGSCAQVGKDCHLSGGSGIGGVLEPSHARSTIVGDRVFVGANTEVAEGVIVGSGAVLAAGLAVTSSIDIYERDPAKPGQKVFRKLPRGRIPKNAVVIGGSVRCGHTIDDGHLSKNVLIVAKYRDERTDSKTALEEALRG